MCNEATHNKFYFTTNGCCLKPDCDWHGPYMLDGSGRAEIEHQRFGNSHCPRCGWGKHVDDNIISTPLLLAAQLLLNREEVN